MLEDGPAVGVVEATGREMAVGGWEVGLDEEEGHVLLWRAVGGWLGGWDVLSRRKWKRWMGEYVDE